MNPIVFGTVRCFDTKTGSGWISPNSGGPDISVRPAAISHANLGQLSKGQTLGFSVHKDNRTAVDLWATWSNR